MPMNATYPAKLDEYIQYMKLRGEESSRAIISEVGAQNYKEVSKRINLALRKTAEHLRQIAIRVSDHEDTLISTLLTIEYACSVAMIDLRNEVWPYDYMSFSRRMGELWESFVRIPFGYSRVLEPVIPPLFNDIRIKLQFEVHAYIDQLNISNAQKDELKNMYDKVWMLLHAGEVSLELDVHVRKNNLCYNIDFKSGFGSNEKGNTNRLLMVAAIYKHFMDNQKCILLVRSDEEHNNHYFRTLKKSGVWEACCGRESYHAIQNITGFNILSWIHQNINWERDLTGKTYSFLRSQNLLSYIEW